jgi:DNA-binding protein YbaB
VAVSEAKRQEAKKLELLAQVVKPYDQMQQHMRELAKEWQQTKCKKKKEIKLVKVKRRESNQHGNSRRMHGTLQRRKPEQEAKK